MSYPICPLCGKSETTGGCGCPRFIYPNSGYLPQDYGPVAKGVADDKDRRIAELEAEVERLTREIADQSETVQRHYPTPLQWQQARARISTLERATARIGDLIGSWHSGDPMDVLVSDVRLAIDNLKQTRQERNKAEAEVERLKADGERLDWMEAQMKQKNCWLPGYNRHAKTWFVVDESENEPTFRAALDAARK